MDARDQELDGLRRILKDMKNGRLVMKLNRTDVTAREIVIVEKEIASLEARKRGTKAA
jgi:hypothetical protein